MKWYKQQKNLYEAKSSGDENDSSQNLKNDEVKEYIEEKVIRVANNDLDRGLQATEGSAYDEKLDMMLDGVQEDTYPHFEEDEEPKDVSYFSKTTIITGNIESDEDIIIHGSLHGNIISNANINVYGEVQGDIQGLDAYFEDALISGNVSCHRVEVYSGSTIIGDVSGTELINGGKLKGNVFIDGLTTMTSTSALLGDLNTNELEIERGSVIQGNLKMKREVYIEDLGDDAILF